MCINVERVANENADRTPTNPRFAFWSLAFEFTSKAIDGCLMHMPGATLLQVFCAECSATVLLTIANTCIHPLNHLLTQHTLHPNLA